MAGGRLLKYLTYRVVIGLVTLYIIVTITWILFEAMPGDPTSLFINPQFPPDVIQSLREMFGLDKPWYIRYFRFVKNLFTFRFGYSIYYHQPVKAMLAPAIPRTLLLLGTADILAYFIGYKWGTYIGWKRGKAIEGATVVTQLFFYNMPSFWIGIVMLYVFAFKLNIFPVGGFYDPNDIERLSRFFHIELQKGFLFFTLDSLYHLFLPLFTLVLIFMAGPTLLMRTSILEVMGEDYVLTAIAKGIPEKQVLRRHVARNALLPMVTSIILSMAAAVGGLIITEAVFSYPGTGRLYYEALIRQDFPVAGATLFIIAILTIAGVILADILYAYLDPRVKL